MKLFFEAGNHSQILEICDGKILKAYCDCYYGSIHPEAWEQGATICKHISGVLRNLKYCKKIIAICPKCQCEISENYTGEMK